MIIGVCGLIGAGKDTIADYLVNIHQFRRESFANTLKDAVSAVFGWDRELLEGRTRQSREWREQPDPWWTQRLGMTVTPRWVLQYWGTEVVRKSFHDDTWIASLENKLRKTTDDVVISDCRFPNEIRAIKNAGGLVIRVHRGPDPEWYTFAEMVNRGPERNLEWSWAKTQLDKFNIHASETAWIGTAFDAVLDNNGTMDHLYSQVKRLVQDLPGAKADQS
jgi:hypothetical protein